MNNEEILDRLATLGSDLPLSCKDKVKQDYSRAELLSAALYGINELHAECVELLAKHSPFKGTYSSGSK